MSSRALRYSGQSVQTALKAPRRTIPRQEPVDNTVEKQKYSKDFVPSGPSSGSGLQARKNKAWQDMEAIAAGQQQHLASIEEASKERSADSVIDSLLKEANLNELKPAPSYDGSVKLTASSLNSCVSNGDWKEMYYQLVECQNEQQQVVRAFGNPEDTTIPTTLLHTAVWKAPPALTRFLLELISKADPINYRTRLLRQDADGNIPLHTCCANLAVTSPSAQQRNGSKVDISALKLILQKSAPWMLKEQNLQGDTPLHLLVASPACTDPSTATFATEAAAEAAVSCLLDFNVDAATVQDISGATPLHIAISTGAHERIVMRLIEMAPDAANVPDKKGLLPLHYLAAFARTSSSIAKLLVEAYPPALVHGTEKAGDTPLHLLVSNASATLGNAANLDRNTSKFLELLMEPAASIRFDDSEEKIQEEEKEALQYPLMKKNAEELTPLHCCALFETPLPVVRALMKGKVAHQAATVGNAFRATPLHLACAQSSVAQSIDMVLALATKHAAATLDSLKRTPLHVASQNRHATPELITVLSDLCPKATSAKTQRGHLPLHLAAQSQATEAVVMALVHANPKAAETKNKNSNTPLHDAAKYRASSGVVQILLDAYPDAIYIQNQYGNLPLHCSTAYEAPSEVVQLLLSAWPDGAAMQNRSQDAPLHYAAACATSADALKPLIDAAPAAVLLLNSQGQSPIDKAKTNNAPQDVIDLLEASAAEWAKKASSADGYKALASDF